MAHIIDSSTAEFVARINAHDPRGIIALCTALRITSALTAWVRVCRVVSDWNKLGLAISSLFPD